MNIPGVDIFNNHGLYDIVIDSTGSRSVGQSASGWANLDPKRGFPLLEPASKGTVKFYWCSETDRDAVRYFKRCCQAYAIATLPCGPTTKGKQADNGRRVLAWWEKDGLWMITNEPRDETVYLGTWWTGRLAEQQSEGSSKDLDAAGLKTDSQGIIYADACDVFAGMTEAVKVSFAVDSY
jgi:hypothetical protein